MIRRALLYLITIIVCLPLSGAGWLHYTSKDGLATGEAHQIIELPNGQLLVNCEGVFCLFNGRRFETLEWDRRKTTHLPHYLDSYAHIWQGDSVLWLRDFYNLYAFDIRTRTFRYDLKEDVTRTEMKKFVSGEAF